MKTLRDIQVLEGVKVLVRVDFNVPVEAGVVKDDFRIYATIPTIEFLRSRGAKIIMVSHMESSNGKNPSLEPVAAHLKKLGQSVTFVANYKDAHGFIENKMQNGDAILLENLRMYEGEKGNDPKFAKELASLADIYVNEAFSTSHREHASIVGVPKLLPGYAGLQLEKEVIHLSRAFNPPRPFLFMLGGAKFETKFPLLEKFMNIADMVFVGGALANDFFRARGYNIGKSRVSEGTFDLHGFINSPKLILPVDILNQNREPRPSNALKDDDKNLDVGPQTVDLLKEKVAKAKLILWNGPLGLYEEGFTDATLHLATIISNATERGVQTIVGGGDTLGAISSQGLQDKFSFISTGGGAMLDFLSKGTLPGIEALENSEN
jgi:phosphoglycerate kinase